MEFEIMKNGVRGIAPNETLLIQAWGTYQYRGFDKGHKNA